MKLLNAKGLKVLKIFHLLFATMWIGGVMALVSLQLGAIPETKEMMYMGANHIFGCNWCWIYGRAYRAQYRILRTNPCRKPPYRTILGKCL